MQAPSLPNDAVYLVFLWAAPATHRYHLLKDFLVPDSLSLAVWCLILLLGLWSHITDSDRNCHGSALISKGFSPKPRNLETRGMKQVRFLHQRQTLVPFAEPVGLWELRDLSEVSHTWAASEGLGLPHKGAMDVTTWLWRAARGQKHRWAQAWLTLRPGAWTECAGAREWPTKGSHLELKSSRRRKIQPVGEDSQLKPQQAEIGEEFGSEVCLG